MKFVQSIIAVVILLFGTGGTDGNTIDTPALNPYTHYINITILYHIEYISSLYRSSEEVLPEYGVVLASCFLNISNQVANSTTYITSDIASVSVQNVNISLFLDSYRVTQTLDVKGEGDTMVIFEFYISQDDTLIPATTAIEVFNRNCNVNDWRDDFTSNDITAVAVFSSMQLMQSISSQIVSTTFSQNTQISTFSTSSIQSLEPTIEVSSTVTSSQRMTTSVSTSQSPETSSIESSPTAIPLATTIPSSMLQLSTSIPSPSASSSQYASQTESTTITEFTSSYSLITSARITPSTTVIPTDTIPITQSTSVLTDSITNFGNIVINYFSSSSNPPRILQSQSIFVSPMDTSFVSATITQSSRLPTNNITISRNFTGSSITGSSSSSLPIQPIPTQSSIVRTMDSSFVSTSIPQSSRIPTYTMSSSRDLSTSNITRISSNSLPTDSIRTILSQSMSTRATNLTTIMSNSTQFVTRSSQSLDRNLSRTNSTQFLFTNSTVILSQQTSTSISTSQPFNTTRLLFSSSYTPLPVSSVPTTQSQSNTFRTTDSRNIISSFLYPVNATQFITPVSVTTNRSLVSDLAQTNSTQLLLNSTTIPRNISIPTSSSTVLPVISSTQMPSLNVSSRSIPQQPSSTLFNISSVAIIPSTTQSFLSTIQPITSTTTIPSPIQPTLHYLEAIFTFETLSDVVIHQIPYILQAIANRYLDTTVSMLPSESALLLSITIGDVTFHALIDQLNQSRLLDSIDIARILFYVTNNTTPLLSTDLKTQLDVYSIDQWSNSTGLQVMSVEFNLYGLVPSSSIPTTSQITPTLSIISTLVRSSLIRSSIITQSMPAATTLPFQSPPSSIIPSRPSTPLTNRTVSVASRIQVMTSLTQASTPVSSTSLLPAQSTRIQGMTSRNLTQSVSVNDTMRTQVYTTSNIPTISSVIPVFSASSVIPILSTRSTVVSIFTNKSSIPSIFNSSSSVHSTTLHSISSSVSTVSTLTPPPGYISLPDYNPSIGYLLVLTLLTNQSLGGANLTQSFYLNTELQLTNLFSLALEKESSVNNRRRRNVFNTTTRVACGIVQDLTTTDTNLRLVFYISREVNNNPLIVLTANTSLTTYRQLEDSDYEDSLGYEFLSISIYQGIGPQVATLALLIGCILGCCILILVVFLITLTLYHCLHSNYIRVDRWSPEKSLDVSFPNQGVYTGSSTKLLLEEVVSVTDRFSEGTQTLARDFLDRTDQFAGDRTDYTFTLRTEPNLLSPAQSDEARPLKREDLDQSDTPQFSQSLVGMKSVIEEERRLTSLAESSLLEIMSSNRIHMDSMLEENARREMASVVYERSKKDMDVSIGVHTTSLRSSEDSSRSQSRPKSGRGSKVAPSNEAPNLSFSNKSTPPAKILDWVPVERLSKPAQLTGFRSVRQPNIMQVVPRQGARPLSSLPSYTPTPDPPTPIPVRIVGADGKPIQMLSSNTDGVATTNTINVLPSFNPFYSTAKKDYPPV